MTRYLDPVLLWTVAATATSRVRLNASTLSTFYYPAWSSLGWR
jgi:alkanesulfonate monooxygenase SsuD/methylene tetrahydromethanopterin reductase-like flavin-dependent oxidoreductase (luciferase family)